MTSVSKNIGRLLCDALGLPANDTLSIHLHCHAGEPVTVVITRLLRDEDAAPIGTILQRYHLEPNIDTLENEP